jgi:hypothetical protein
MGKETTSFPILNLKRCCKEQMQEIYDQGIAKTPERKTFRSLSYPNEKDIFFKRLFGAVFEKFSMRLLPFN